MINVAKLRDAIKRSDYTIKTLSAAIGIDESTFYRKLSRDGCTFTLEQADAIQKTLKLDLKDAHEIFFHNCY